MATRADSKRGANVTHLPTARKSDTKEMPPKVSFGRRIRKKFRLFSVRAGMDLPFFFLAVSYTHLSRPVPGGPGGTFLCHEGPGSLSLRSSAYRMDQIAGKNHGNAHGKSPRYPTLLFFRRC